MAPEGDDRLRDTEEELAAAREGDDLERLASALIGHARALHAATHHDDALVDLAEVIDRCDPAEDIEHRELATWARHLRLLWSAKAPEDRLAQAREIFALCNDQPSPALERRAALALGIQADAQRELGDVAAAIATRRWLVSEFGDVRPDGRLDLVCNQRYMLARDLLDDERVDEAVQECDALVAVLEEAEVSARDTRIADALALSMYPLWRRGDRERLLEVNEQLQRRFARCGEALARVAAVDGLSTVIRTYLYDDGDIPSALQLERELLGRLVAESDADAGARIARELQDVADDLVAAYGPVRFIWWTSLVARIAEHNPRMLRRRRLRRAAATLARLDAASEATRLLAERFRDDPSSRGRAIYGRTIIHRGMIATRRGRMGAGAATLGDFFALPSATVEAVIASAGHSRLVDRTAAMLALTMRGIDDPSVRMKATEILGTATTPAASGRVQRATARLFTAGRH